MLGKALPTKYFNKRLIMTFCEKAYDDLKDREMSLVSHLRNEINRLGKDGG